MFSSSISDIKIINSPVQVFSINGAEDLTLSGITIDNSDGDVAEGGHNTDAFDVGSSSGITITGATVYNQDDCLAVNSGTVLTKTHEEIGSDANMD
jgi:polygalacturonase